MKLHAVSQQRLTLSSASAKQAQRERDVKGSLWRAYSVRYGWTLKAGRSCRRESESFLGKAWCVGVLISLPLPPGNCEAASPDVEATSLWGSGIPERISHPIEETHLHSIQMYNIE